MTSGRQNEASLRLAEIILGSHWRHHSTGVYEVVGLYGPDEIELERPDPSQGDVWRRRVRLDYFRDNFTRASRG